MADFPFTPLSGWTFFAGTGHTSNSVTFPPGVGIKKVLARFVEKA